MVTYSCGVDPVQAVEGVVVLELVHGLVVHVKHVAAALVAHIPDHNGRLLKRPVAKQVQDLQAMGMECVDTNADSRTVSLSMTPSMYGDHVYATGWPGMLIFEFSTLYSALTISWSVSFRKQEKLPLEQLT